ncbi:MAG: EAL domain-containing protein, partial [Sulfurovum sp.]|nr:EAL domain-containing protein [Sulfurovum sp.]
MESVLSTVKTFMQTLSTTDYFFLFAVLFLVAYFTMLKKSKQQLESKLDTNTNVFKKAFDVIDDAIMILSEKQEIVYANPAMVDLLELQEHYQRNILKPMPKIKIKKSWFGLDQLLKEEKSKASKKVLSYPKTTLRISDTNEKIVNLYINIEQYEQAKKSYYGIVTIQDLSQSQATEALGFTHKLTGLPNQIQAMQDLPILYSKIHIENNKIALVLLSFDNFSRLRSIIGYEQSNEVLKKFATYLKSIVSKMNLNIYHTYDNHFLLTVSNVNREEDVKALMAEIQMKLAAFYKMENENLHLTVSAGIALYPDSGPTRKLLDNTYKALVAAQKEGDGKVEVYLPEKAKEAYDELRLHNDMQKGLDKGEFEVYYQPIIRVGDEAVVAAEALIRWVHPELGFIPPDVFIGLMEKTGFIIKLGQFVLEEVLKQQKRWELFKFKPIKVSVNLSMVEIATGEFVEHVEAQLKHHRVHADRIKFEITEGMAMIGESQTIKYFDKLKKLGVGISLDDFGTGYTSFTYLKKFPADILKIDKSLVDNILTNEEDQRIVRAIIELGHNLGMKIVV